MSSKNELTIVKQYLQDGRGCMRHWGGYGYFRLLLCRVNEMQRAGLRTTRVLRRSQSVPNRGRTERSSRVQLDRAYDGYLEQELRERQGVDDMPPEIMADYVQEF